MLMSSPEDAPLEERRATAQTGEPTSMKTLEASTTAMRILNAAAAAYRRSDLPRLAEVVGRARSYAEHMDIRLVRARNSRRYNQSYDNGAAAAHIIRDRAEKLLSRLMEEEERYEPEPWGDMAYYGIEDYRNAHAIHGACPWAVAIERVEGGWRCHKTWTSYELSQRTR